jgi:hypothetical protein
MMRKTTKTPAFTLAAFVPFVLAACGTEPPPADEMAPPAETPAPADAPMDHAMTYLAQVVPVGESGITGDVELTALNGETEVRVTLRNAPEGTHRGHVHEGTCEAPGGVVAPLTAVTTDATGTGQAATTLELGIMTLMNGNHIVLYHEAGGEPGAPVACATIPAHTM